MAWNKAGWFFSSKGYYLSYVGRFALSYDICLELISNQEVGRKIKRIATQNNPLAGLLLELWERDLL